MTKLDCSKASAYYKARRAAGQETTRAYDDGHQDGMHKGYRIGYDQGHKDGTAGKPHRFDSRNNSR